MILNHSETMRSVTSLLYISVMVYLISCTTPACFSTFYRCAMVLTLVENSNISVYLLSSVIIWDHYSSHQLLFHYGRWIIRTCC